MPAEAANAAPLAFALESRKIGRYENRKGGK